VPPVDVLIWIYPVRTTARSETKLPKAIPLETKRERTCADELDTSSVNLPVLGVVRPTGPFMAVLVTGPDCQLELTATIAAAVELSDVLLTGPFNQELFERIAFAPVALWNAIDLRADDWTVKELETARFVIVELTMVAVPVTLRVANTPLSVEFLTPV